MLLFALLHFFVGLMKTTVQMWSSVSMSGPLFMAIAWLMFFQFRFADPRSVLTGLPCVPVDVDSSGHVSCDHFTPFVFLDVYRWCSRHRKCRRTFPAPNVVEGGFGVLPLPLLSCEYCFQLSHSSSESAESASCTQEISVRMLIELTTDAVFRLVLAHPQVLGCSAGYCFIAWISRVW